jgi:hypothetical protein
MTRNESSRRSRAEEERATGADLAVTFLHSGAVLGGATETAAGVYGLIWHAAR